MLLLCVLTGIYVELYINNKSVSNGKQSHKLLEYYAVDIEYSAREISANCVDANDKVLKTETLTTTGAASQIQLEWTYPYNSESEYNNTIYGDGLDVALISVYVLDAQDRNSTKFKQYDTIFSG